jgi:hypothetical protein
MNKSKGPAMWSPKVKVTACILLKNCMMLEELKSVFYQEMVQGLIIEWEEDKKEFELLGI